MDDINAVYRYILEGIKYKHIDKSIGAVIIQALQESSGTEKKDIAIIGMAGRFPHAQNLKEFWDKIIKNGVDAVGQFPKARSADVTPILLGIGNGNDEKVMYRYGAYLEDISSFDHQFFQLSLREAKLMDPNQRLFLQTAWEAIEDAGYGGKRLYGSSTGIFVGYSSDMNIEYKRAIQLVQPDMEELALAGNIKSIIASRLAYILDLKGPSMLIDTACSSSLVAVHAACQAIRNKECDQAIAGSIKICLAPFVAGDESGSVRIVSPGGRAKTFDDSADGTGLGEGVAVIILKRLDRALSDGDQIYAVIKGSAVNQDGSSIGITAPNPAAQEQVIIKAWENAGINPATISYIEAHGTGTPLGDPIEIEGITSAFRRYTTKKQFCAIGSVKTNIGHLDNAAGIAGLIKTVLALKYKQIPATINFKKPNSKISFEESPVYINDKTSAWETQGYPRRAGVSSFGLSGTNCHMVLEEAPDTEDKAENTPDENKTNILALSAKSLISLNKLIGMYLKFLKKANNLNMEDLCYSANTGRGHYNHRLAVLFNNIDMLIEKLDGLFITGELYDNEKSIFYKEHKVVGVNGDKENIVGITEEEKLKLTAEASDKIERLMHGNSADNEETLKELCNLYINGAEINWINLYKDKEYKKVSVPLYPFLKQRVWLDVDRKFLKVSTSDASRKTAGSSFFKMSWRKQPLTIAGSDVLTGISLVFYKEKNSFTEKLIKYIESKGSECVEIAMINDPEQAEPHKYSVCSKPEHYSEVLNTLNTRNIRNIFFIDIMEIETVRTDKYEEEIAALASETTYNLFYLTKSLLSAGLTHKINLLVLSNNVYRVKDEKVIRPDSAALFGIARVIKNEYPNFICKCMDISGIMEVEDILKELNHDDGCNQVVYRDGERYVEELDLLDLGLLEDAKVEIKDQGAYIITGGLGGIGIEIAKYLASQNKVKIAMINRIAFPPANEWDRILQLQQDNKICSKIKKLKELQSLGAEVKLYCADVSNEKIMEQIIDSIRAEFGRINGIVHCAGVAGKDFIFRKDESRFAEVLRPKINGTLILDKLTWNDKMDFFVLFSSTSSFLAEVGQGDYAAANSFLDAYSIYRRLKGKRTTAINWPAWKETGMALDYGVNKDGIYKAIATEDALKAFARVLEKDASNVIVGEINCESIGYNDLTRINISEKVKSLVGNRENSSHEGFDSIPMHYKTTLTVEMKGRRNNEYNKVEKTIAQILGDVLEMKKIDIYEPFHDLGGDSISAGILVQKINQVYPEVLSVVDVYAYPTVAQMAEFIVNALNGSDEKQGGKENEEDELKSILRRLRTGEVSLDETLEFLNEEWEDD